MEPEPETRAPSRRSDPMPSMPAGPSPATLRRRFLAALALVGAIAAGEYVAMRVLLDRESDRTALLERAARQRMLVQRAAVLTHEILGAPPARRDSLRQEMAGVVEAIDQWHVTTVHGERLTPEQQRAFFEDPLQLDRSLHAYLEAMREVADGPDSAVVLTGRSVRIVIAAARGGPSATLNALVDRLVAESVAAIRQGERISQLMLIGLLVLLLGIGFGMFRPALRQLEREHHLRTRAFEQLRALSTQDALTEIPNRRAFDQWFEEEWRRAQREHHNIALLMADIDHFKLYNDAYGHQRGDDCLRQIAAALAGTVARPADFVARYGGEEFAIVLPQTTDHGSHGVAEALRRAVEALGLPNARGTGPVTISVGAAIITPTAADGPEALVAAADRALYRAKQNGRNRVETATTG